LDANIVAVFDGSTPPCKEQEAQVRRDKRAESLEAALEAQRCGEVVKATKLFREAVRVPKELSALVCSTLLANNFEVVVAPYEADHQLVHMQQTGQLDFILTDDSDILVYGGDNVLYKYSSGSNMAFIATQARVFQNHPPYDISTWTPGHLRLFALLIGSDYNGGGLSGCGKLGAYKAVSACDGTLDSLMNHLFQSSRFRPDVLQHFGIQAKLAEAAMQCQTVFCTQSGEFIFLKIPESEQERDFVGSPELISMYDAKLCAAGQELPFPACTPSIKINIDAAIAPDGFPKDGWFTDFAVIKGHIPIMFATVAIDYFVNGLGSNGRPRNAHAAYNGGIQRAESMQTLKGFAWHYNPNAAIPPGTARVQYARVRIPTSAGAAVLDPNKWRPVYAAFLVENPAPSEEQSGCITAILNVECNCHASASMVCQHLSALCWVIATISRRAAEPERPSCTGVPCWWTRPAGAKPVDVAIPIRKWKITKRKNKDTAIKRSHEPKNWDLTVQDLQIDVESLKKLAAAPEFKRYGLKFSHDLVGDANAS